MSRIVNNPLRNHDDNGASNPTGDIDTVADNRGRNAFYNLAVGGLVIASLRNLNRRYRGKLNVRLLCLDMSQRRAGLSSILDYERAVCNAIADLEAQGSVKVGKGGLYKNGKPNMGVKVYLTELI